MKLQISASSQKGCIRNNNEDFVLVYDTFIRDNTCETVIDTDETKRFVIAIADGMGGHSSGEVASEQSLRNLHYYISDLPSSLSSDEFKHYMSQWLISINKILVDMGTLESQPKSMGTTLIGLVFYDNRLYMINCGDSRLYHYSSGRLQQLSKDHSLNMVTGETKHSHVLVNCIGGGCTTSYFDIMELADCVNDFSAGDILMLCSDGLSDMVSDDLIESKINNIDNADMMCDEAIIKGGFDNVSVCLIKIL